MNLNDNLIKMIYGHDVDVIKLKKIKNFNEIWNDIFLFLSNNDITKIEEIKKMKAIDIFEILKSKMKQIPKIAKKLIL